MLTENEKKEMAQDAGWSDDLYTDKVKQGVVSELGLKTPDETAILRKALAELLSEFSELKLFVKGKGISSEAITEFIIYNANVEQIKVKAKEDTQ